MSVDIRLEGLNEILVRLDKITSPDKVNQALAMFGMEAVPGRKDER